MNTTGDTFRQFAHLSLLRKTYAALRRGDTNVVFSTSHTGTEDDAGMFAFERAGGDAGDRYALVVFGTNARKTSTANPKVSINPGTVLVDLLDPNTSVTVAQDGTLKVSNLAQSVRIFVPQGQIIKLP
jgi:hypothetical protein